jgi:DNA-binding CsgD family transcriptional regulator
MRSGIGCIYHKWGILGIKAVGMTEPHWSLAGEVVTALGGAGLPHTLAALLRSVTPFSYTVIFGYRGADRPLALYDDFPAGKRKIFVTDYQAGPYLLDPFFLAASRSVAPGLYRLRDLAPDRFYQGEYFRSYYVQTGLAEEIAYFVNLPDRSTVTLSLMRTEKRFSEREFAALNLVFPFVSAIAQRHWKALDPKPAKVGGSRQSPQINQDLGAFGAGILTPREREVAELTLKGHSAESSGKLLGIAVGTVRIHRRNIYAKLNINSQGALFSRFLSMTASPP